MRKPIQSLSGLLPLPMYELVISILHSKLLSAFRLPSFAGKGLPERMRSISFALLGLTAAAGLAIVALFAQPSFPLLSPAPLPAEPSATESISDAKKLQRDRGPVALFTALPAAVHRGDGGASAGAPVDGPSGSTDPAGGSDGSQVASAVVDAPAPSSPRPPSSGKGGGAGSGTGTGGGSGPAPAAAPAQPAPSPSPPVSSSKPPAPKPEAIASAPKPDPAPAPGNSSSAAAAEHASERGIEASASSGPPAATPTTASVVPESPSPPGNGNGLAKGHSK